MNKDISTEELIHQFSVAEDGSFTMREDALLHEITEQAENKTSIAITILSIFGGVFSTGAFLAFLFITGIYESEEAILVLGIGLIGASLWLNKAFNKISIDAISVTAYLIGLVMIGFSFAEIGLLPFHIFMIFILLAFVSLAIIRTFVLSLLSFLLIFGSSFGMVIENTGTFTTINIYMVVLVLLFAGVSLNESTILAHAKKLSKLYQPLYLALVVSLISLLLVGFTAINYVDYEASTVDVSWLPSIIISMAILYVTFKITSLFFVELSQLQQILIYGGTIFILAPTLFAPSLSGTLLIVLISYYVNNNVSLVMGILAFIYSIFQFYYYLGYTLLFKSILLFVTGVLFLLVYFLFTFKSTSNEKI